MKIFGREPALLLGLFSAALQFLVAFWLHWDNATVAVVNAAAAAVLGFITAWATRAVDGGSSLQAAILGLAQALLTLGATFGLDWSAVQVASVMGFVAVLASAYVRGHVEPHVGPEMTAPGVR